MLDFPATDDPFLFTFKMCKKQVLHQDLFKTILFLAKRNLLAGNYSKINILKNVLQTFMQSIPHQLDEARL